MTEKVNVIILEPYIGRITMDTGPKTKYEKDPTLHFRGTYHPPPNDEFGDLGEFLVYEKVVN